MEISDATCYPPLKIAFDMNMNMSSKIDEFHQEKAGSGSLFTDGTQSIRRTISLIREISDSNGKGIRLSHIAKRVGIPTSTVHRMLSVLVSEGFIEYDSISKLYYLGFALYALGNKAYQFSIREKYRGCLECIAQVTDDSVYFVRRTGYDAICIDFIEGKFPIRTVTYNVGTLRPLGVGSASLVLLSFLNNDEIETVLEANKLRYNEYNKMTVTKLRGLIKHTRKLGYAFNEGYFMKNINGVGVPICSDQGEVIAAISVGSFFERIDREKSKQIAELIKSEISKIR